MALTWGQGIDEDQYASMGLDPSREDSWLRYMKQTGQLPNWVGSKDDFEAYDNGWVRGSNGQWIDAGTAGDDYQAAMRELATAMTAQQGNYFRAGMPTDQYEAGYREWANAYQAAEDQVRQRMGVKLQAKMPWEQLGFNRRRNGQDSAAMFDGIFNNLAAGSSLWQHNGSDIARRAADYDFAFGDAAKHSRGRLSHLADFGTWMHSQSDPTKRSQATKAYGQWDQAWNAGTMQDDWQTYVNAALKANEPAPPAPPAPPPTAVTAQPGYTANGTLSQAYKPTGLLGSTMKRPPGV